MWACYVIEADEMWRLRIIVSMLFLNHGMKGYDYCEHERQSRKKLLQADLAKNDLKRVDYVFHIWDLPSCQVCNKQLPTSNKKSTITSYKQ
jgi:hypothetical protein